MAAKSPSPEPSGRAVLKLRVSPGAKKSEIVGPHGDAFRVKVAAPPVDGKANEALLEFLSEIFGVPRRQVSLLSGQTSRDKVVEIAARSRPEDAIHLEHFQADPAASAAPAGSFEVELASSGVVLHVPAESSLVDVLQAHGCDIDTECREGICGTCIVEVLEGEPEHRDNCLSNKEKAANKQICACVSRARSARLVLDL